MEHAALLEDIRSALRTIAQERRIENAVLADIHDATARTARALQSEPPSDLFAAEAAAATLLRFARARSDPAVPALEQLSARLQQECLAAAEAAAEAAAHHGSPSHGAPAKK